MSADPTQILVSRASPGAVSGWRKKRSRSPKPGERLRFIK
jgi:hypothetical protein